MTAGNKNTAKLRSAQLTKGRVVAASGEEGCASGW